MNLDERHRFLETIDQLMRHRAEAQVRLNNNLKEFSARLFAALENVLNEVAASGTPGLGKPRRLVHPAGGGREALQIFIEDWSIIFVPLLGIARPNVADEARVPPGQFKELCARIAVFLTDDPDGDAFYDFIIFQDGSWFAWGYGWPKQQDDIESTDFNALAVDLIHSFIKDIFVTWNTRSNTPLATAMDARKRAYVYGLPGEDRGV
ncbi:MAG: hypothetical protein GXY36_14555 [Chloroflexi bacterium]|nr:hypothetical protein [Chloroflexota bacterium]